MSESPQTTEYSGADRESLPRGSSNSLQEGHRAEEPRGKSSSKPSAVVGEQSPITLKLSHSQLAAWDRCRYLWHIQYVEDWHSTRPKPYLETGRLVHKFLEKYYLNLMDPILYPPLDLRSESQLAFEAIQNNPDPEAGIQPIKLATFLVHKYVTEFSSQDEDFKVLAVEKHFEIPLVTPKGNRFVLQGYIDLLLSRRQRLVIMDHKTSGKFWTTLAADMDSQQPTYAAALREEGLRIDDIIFNLIKTYDYKDLSKVDPNQVFKRIETYRTQTELDNFMLNLYKQVDSLYENRHNIFRSLKKECESCFMQEPCQLALKGIPIEDVLEGGDFRKGGER